MTTTYALQVFDVLQDKYGAPYFPDDWKLKIFNMAQLERFKSLLPDDTEKGTVNYSYDYNTYDNIKPFLFNLSLISNSGGTITDAQINTALQSRTGNSNDVYFRIEAMFQLTTNLPIRWMNPNQRAEFTRNVFKAPSSSDLRYILQFNSLDILPGTTYNVVMSIIKYPLQMSLSPNQNPEWDDYNMNEIIAGALKLAGIATRETDELIQDVRLAGLSVK